MMENDDTVTDSRNMGNVHTDVAFATSCAAFPPYVAGRGKLERHVRGAERRYFDGYGFRSVMPPVEASVWSARSRAVELTYLGERSVPSSWYVAKRAIDLIVGTMALLGTAPLIAVAALGIVCVSPGSPLFLQERIGKNGRSFKLFKLRTMVDGAHLVHAQMHVYNDVSGPVLKIRNDPRLHALGKFLRRTSIDELPNLINVLRGEMSLVGPRPPLGCEVASYDEFALRRLRVKPGITCLWQILGRSDISFDEWMRLDDAYIENWSPLGDLAILARTIPAVLRGEGAH